MADSGISIASISAQKQTETSNSAQVTVLKKALDQSESVSEKLVSSATVPPPGVGTKVNTVA